MSPFLTALNHSAIVNSLRVVDLPPVVFLLRRGPVGTSLTLQSWCFFTFGGFPCFFCAFLLRFQGLEGFSRKIGTPQTGRLLNGAFGPSRNSIRHNLGVCHTDIARHRHVLGGFVKTSTTIALFDSAIRTDLDSLITPFFAPNANQFKNAKKMADSRLHVTVRCCCR